MYDKFKFVAFSPPAKIFYKKNKFEYSFNGMLMIVILYSDMMFKNFFLSSFHTLMSQIISCFFFQKKKQEILNLFYNFLIYLLLKYNNNITTTCGTLGKVMPESHQNFQIK